MKKKKVYLFACIEKNIGDDLFIYIVSHRYPNVEFIISSDANYLKINSLKNLKYSNKLKTWLIFANNGSKNIIKRNFASFIEKIYRISLKKLDSIYIVGNAFKNIDYKGHYQINWLNKRINLSKKFYLISTNYGPSNSEEWKNDCYKAFSKMADVCFRDINSYETFNSLSNVRYAPDAVLSIDINNKKRKLNVTHDYIIISIIDCAMNTRSKKLNEIAPIYEKKMISVINEFNEKGINIILLNSNAIQDKPASTRIYEKCKNKNMISICNYDGNLEKIFKLYNNAKAIIATRLHTIILGWIYDIPVVPIVYDVKVENILKSYNFNGLVEDICNLNDMNASSIYDSIKKYSFKISQKIINDANNQFINIDKILK